MKRTCTFFFVVHLALAKAQVYHGPGGTVQNNGMDTKFTITITDLTKASLDTTFGLEQVCFTIDHPDVSELDIFLRSPSGTRVDLSLGTSTSGGGFTNTCVNSSADTSITLASSPYTGKYKPIGYLGRFNTGQTANGTWTLVVHDGSVNAREGKLVSWSLQFGNKPAHPVVLRSSNLPVVCIVADQPITDSKTRVSLGIIQNAGKRNHVTDPCNAFKAVAEIHWHGNSTKNFEKKAFSFKTMDADGNKLTASILGLPAENDWMLIASYLDKTLLRIPLAYDLFRRMGHYAPRYRYVELTVNGEYQGIYVLMEKIKRDSCRVHVQTMSAASNAWPAVSGGYIVKIDRPDVPGWHSLMPGQSRAGSHFYYNYVYPKPTEITPQQQTYIKSFIDSFETIMASPDYANTLNGYHKFIGLRTFVDYFIINELSRNVDGYRLSAYLYKKNQVKGGKLCAGPAWDYDLAWHNCNYGSGSACTGWQYQMQDDNYPVPTWWSRFMEDTGFTKALYCRWIELRQNILSITSLNKYIDSTGQLLNESQQRNFTQFPVLGTYLYPNPQEQAGASYQGELNDLKTWIADRIAWLDGAITGQCSASSPPAVIVKNKISISPNPMVTSTTFNLNLAETSEVSLCIKDLVGKEVSRYAKRRAPKGETRINFERNQLPPGVYVYQLKINNALHTGKLVIQ